MAICEYCNQEMMTAKGCTELFILVNGKEYPRLPYGRDERAPDLAADKRNCHDCNCAWDHMHHFGCDMEECVKCHGQLISCGCDAIEVPS